MKKTFKKQLILLAVITVMMILALVMPASAEGEEIPCNGKITGTHLAYYLKDITIDATCTQRGYTKTICTYCDDMVVIDAKDPTSPLGHDFEVSYALVTGENGEQYYERIRTCAREDVPCQRYGDDIFDGSDDILPEEDNCAFKAEDENGVIKYYLVNYLNEFESPDEKSPTHADSYLDEYYVPGKSKTWVLNCEYGKEAESGVYDPKTYVSGKEATVDGTVAAPDYEFVTGTEALELFVRENQDAPKYVGVKPGRGKDLTYGAYDFTEWAYSETKDGKRIYTAQFEPKDVSVLVAFYNEDGKKLTTDYSIHYGHDISYKELVTPAKDADQMNSYTFAGWTLDGNTNTLYGLEEEIVLYFGTEITAHFVPTVNNYELNFVKKDGTPFTVKKAEGTVPLTDVSAAYGADLSAIIAGQGGISGDQFEVPNDKQYKYVRDDRVWVIKSVNGKEITNDVTISVNKLNLPKSAYISVDGVIDEHFFGKGDIITLTPKYDPYVLYYTFKVSIKTAYFLDEDVYPDNNVMKSDILDKFIIQVKDNKGGYIIKDGKTDENGDFWFTTPYRDQLTVVASMSNQKYYGEQKISLGGFETYEDIINYEKQGVFVYPEVTQEWLDGLRSCGCICHSILSPIIVRIYNILYKIFGIEYVCCDDLFIVHGSILSYGK